MKDVTKAAIRRKFTKQTYLAAVAAAAIIAGGSAQAQSPSGSTAPDNEHSMEGGNRENIPNSLADTKTPTSGGAQAQGNLAADEAVTAPLSGEGEIVVTGSRIVRDGFSAPTPVTVLGAAEIAAQAPANISDFVNQLPAIAGSGTSANSSPGVSTGTAGVNSINLRGLGTGRTLVLLDGQRSVGSTVGGTVDINTFPQDLVERVEVVTGGASAAYGSDAVGGVVNFILNKNFTGVKLSADQGISTYGDGQNYKLTGSAGLSLADDRLHVLLNAEYFHQTGVAAIDRDWNDSAYFQINNPAYVPGNGAPQRLVGAGFGPATYTAGGLITAGALRGIYFLGNGQTAQLNFGTTNTTSSPYMIGGDYRTTLAGHVGTNSLIPAEDRLGIFNRTTFDLTPNIQIFTQLSWNRYRGQSFYQQTPSTGVVIQPDNAYLRTFYPAVAARVTTPFSIGTSNAGFPVPGSDNERQVYRYVAGASGKFSVLDRSWNWDAYYQHGVTKSYERLINTWNLPRMALAQDAVIAPAGNAAGIAPGTIVCRSTLTNAGNGCVPIDRLGTNGPSASALSYIFGEQPHRDQTIKQDVISASANGELFNLAGGPVAVAMGGEWRKEQINGFVEQQFQPTVLPNGVTVNNWLYGNYLVNKGQYNVKEAFLEVDLPLFKGLNVNAAGRYTHYSTSGNVATWKIGATYQPISDVKFRGNYSHDIRAPNLQELFTAGTARSNAVTLPANSPLGAGSFPFVETTIGNRNLKPERANTWTAGIVLTPQFLKGFSASFDYYDINIKSAIGSLTAQNTIDNCYNLNLNNYCDNIIYVNGALSQVIVQPFNFAGQREKGFDIEAGYTVNLADVSEKLPGKFSIHGTATHYIKNVIDNGIFPIDYAGVNGGSLSQSPVGVFATPKWSYRVSAFYDIDPVILNLVARGYSSGVYGNDYIECTSGCPVSTTRYRTINNNHIDGITYFDASVSFKFKASGADGTLTFVVNNMFNKDPSLAAFGPDGNFVPAFAQTNRYIYDVVGRVFRVSARLKF